MKRKMDTEKTKEQITATKNESTQKDSFAKILADIGICFLAALLVSGSLYYFSNYNKFAPGGVTGFASIIGSWIAAAGLGDVTMNMSILMFAFNLPIFGLVAYFTNRKTGVMLIIYLLFQSGLLMLFKFFEKEFGLSYYAAVDTSDKMYKEGNNVIFAAIGVGVISGLGFSIMLRRFGASGGTYAISALIKHFRPEQNIAWLAFALDSSVVVLAFFVYGSGINSVISTLTNIFISDLVVDYMLQGLRSGYKFEVITEHAEEISAELMKRLHRGVTLLHAEGMYTHTDKALLICIVRKREVGEFLKLLKKYNATFSYSCKVNEVYGNFKPKALKTPPKTDK
ncbi:MAG: YitT family protein [Clostridia bacterium]|nr:YitT family protein [Clostridia bacterium]